MKFHRIFHKQLRMSRRFSLSFIKWAAIAVLIGLIGGAIGTAFRLAVVFSNTTWEQHRWLTWLLPLSGLFIVWLYQKAGVDHPAGTNRVFRSVRREEKLPLKAAPLIFVATVLTHLCGGSAGREGAALQIGGVVEAGTSRILKLHPSDSSIAVLMGMSAVFAALFDTPITTVVFALEVISVGIIHYAGLVPCLISSFIAAGVTEFFAKNEFAGISIAFPTVTAMILLKVMVLGLCCALLSILTVVAFNGMRHLLVRLVSNRYLLVLCGAFLLILLTYLTPSAAYNGSGTEGIMEALQGNARWWSFLVKLLFTAVTLGVGFKGGEVLPTFFVGAELLVVP